MKLFTRDIFLKIAVFLAFFLILHFAYDWLSSPVVAVFSGVRETFIEHAKVGFWAYSAACLLEFVFKRRTISSRSRFIFSRVFATIFSPWLMFVLWYSVPVFYGEFPNLIIDAIYASAITVLLAFILILLERILETIQFPRFFQWLLAGLYLLSALELITISFHIPWAPFF